ncbi:uncharacterized protein [Aegilops tauschii subsp. strangulata]|uniref:uncharacterized protein n=1 Tax=Aegilops tauschii subsp. strangulata TaxID=200361 RepID=UPI001E1CAC2D|nr:uncharacterized protein LOC120972685 [Aegilops tauschii subsp. strangulata]
MPEGTVVAATVFEPSSVRERGRGGRAEVVIPDQGVVEVEDDTPPRADVAERAGTDGGGGGVVLEETLRAAASEAPPVLEEAPRAAVPETVTQRVPASGSETATQGVPEEVLAASRATSGGYALVPRQGERRAAVPQPARSGGAIVFGPQTQEEALEAFAQAEVGRWTPSVAACEAGWNGSRPSPRPRWSGRATWSAPFCILTPSGSPPTIVSRASTGSS